MDVIIVRQRQRGNPGLLQRSGSPYGQKIVNLSNRVGQVGRGQHPSYPPSGHRIGLTHTVDQNGTISHAWKRHDWDVYGSVVQNVLVDLVRDGQAIELLA